MPQGGNFGGGSLPDVIVGGAELVAGKTTTYKDYSCVQGISTGATALFNYTTVTGEPLVVTVGGAGTKSLEMVITPQQVISQTNMAFLCYSCDCDQPMTGTTAFDKTGYGFITTATTVTQVGATATLLNPNTAFATTIIGGEGLNN